MPTLALHLMLDLNWVYRHKFLLFNFTFSFPFIVFLFNKQVSLYTKCSNWISIQTNCMTSSKTTSGGATIWSGDGQSPLLRQTQMDYQSPFHKRDKKIEKYKNEKNKMKELTNMKVWVLQCPQHPGNDDGVAKFLSSNSGNYSIPNPLCRPIFFRLFQRKTPKWD